MRTNTLRLVLLTTFLSITQISFSQQIEIPLIGVYGFLDTLRISTNDGNLGGSGKHIGVTASSDAICTGTTPVTLTANCPVTASPVWYTVAVGGFPFAIGSSVVVNPSINTTYFVGCETPDYKRGRVATKMVLVGNPSTVLNLTAAISTNSLQAANTILTASNKVISLARVTYKAGNSLTFNSGFEVSAGSNFLAQTGGCNLKKNILL